MPEYNTNNTTYEIYICGDKLIRCIQINDEQFNFNAFI